MESPWLAPTLPTHRHQRVHDLLQRLISDGAARFFADACDIAGREPPYRSASHIVAHLLREVESQVLEVLVTLPGIPANLRGKQKAANAHRTKATAILSKLGLSEVADGRAWLDHLEEGSGWVRSAHRHDLGAPRPRDREFLARVDAFVVILDVLLSRAEAEYAATIRSIEKHLLASPPTEADLAEVKPFLGTGVTALAHVFEKVDGTWLSALDGARAFSEPTDIRIYPDGSYSFPPWPPGEYLARIAGTSPDEVCAIIEKLPTVANETIQASLIAAGMSMPPAQAARVARRLSSWLSASKRMHGFMMSKLPRLVECIVAGGTIEQESARDLLRAALALTPGEPDELFPRSRARASNHDYDELVRSTVPPLGEAAPEMLRDLLFELLSVESPERVNQQIGEVEAQHAAGHADPVETLFCALRDYYLARASADASSLRNVVRELDGRGTPLMRRLALHVLRVHGHLAQDLVADRVTAVDALSDYTQDHEMRELVRAQFAPLLGDARARVLAAIRANSSLEQLRTEMPEEEGSALQLMAERRQLEWLTVIGAANLSPDEAAEHAALINTHGMTPPPRARMQWGHRSPVTRHDLLAMPDVDLVTYVRTWQPTRDDPFEPSRDGLADELRAAVEADFARFTALAKSFLGCAPRYLSNLLWGLRDGLRRHVDAPSGQVAWESLLELVEGLLDEEGETGDDAVNSRHSSARGHAVGLAEKIAKQLAPDDEARALRAWAFVRALITDPDPVTKRVHEAGSEVDFAINTVRGQALEAAIEVAVAFDSTGSTCMHAVAEVLACIEARADPGNEPSSAVRCLLAYHFNRLFRFHGRWQSDLHLLVFPTLTDSTDERRAAWRAYLRFNRASTDVFRVIRACYDQAVDRVEHDDPKAAAELGIHLLRLVFSGEIQLQVDDSLPREFVKRAPVEARKTVLNWLGHAAMPNEERESDDRSWLPKVMPFWTWWSQVAGTTADLSDLSTFGWFFANDDLDTSWSLPELERVLELMRGDIERDDLVVQKLGRLSMSSPDSVASCMERLIDVIDPWFIVRTEAYLRSTLESLLPTSAATRARQMASRLLARGYSRFADLTDG
jgi:hypothetical protein